MPKHEQAAERDEVEVEVEVGIELPWQGDWKVDLSSWTTMEPIIAWQEQARRSDFAKMSETMAGVIVQWPYDLPPNDVKSYVKLSPAQWKQAAEQMGRTVGSFFQSADA